ncbi:hypothetical protein ABIC28_002320 [Rhodococcus sp. PvR044]|jgi:hypothetical protein|uniref:hypothetical protein n=1 Tax=Rhodococcus TaxID=1827 RepID=UPI000BC3F327|nr:MULTISPECIES: hypothetical protein [Rhodococcus]MBP1160204.1 hypothetical protein [Rhodococcus sp. PvR099]MCZ4557222.1 hypothetical protein [Rhodococcus maanshanensis]PTR42789.1 hypothetical protein C8K38_11086 [Rhodococcus sp. OK611]SNX91854.1 hypothetical protein SAMN05447004_111141 [Rhodococcus sp. OK270]
MSTEDGPGQTLNASESLDSDEVRNDDGDDVVDAPDHWSEADRFGTTAAEAAAGETLDERLAEEEPDTPLDDDGQQPGDPESVEAEVVDGVIIEDLGITRDQFDGDPIGGGPVK